MTVKPSAQEFKVGDHVVYPAHGVGRINGVETQEVAGLSLEVYAFNDAARAFYERAGFVAERTRMVSDA